MIWFIISLLISIGWHSGFMLYKIVYEIILSRLHNSKWYMKLCKQHDDESKTSTTIGFTDK